MGADEAAELAQRLSVLIGMIMEDEVDGAIATPVQLQINRLQRSGVDIMKVAAAAEVVLRRYGGSGLAESGSKRE
jgi:hypothetical protein